MSNTIVVTGAASGIGRAVVTELRAAGRDVLALDIDQNGLRSLGAQGVAIAWIDLTDAAGLQRVLEGRVDGLAAIVHCAALFPQLTFAQSELADLDRIFAVNFRAAFVLCKAAAGLMARGGSIVLLTSGAGLMDAAQDPFQRPFALYGSSKAALDRWALGVASELAENGIVLTTITPGAFVRTPGTSGIDPGGMPEIEVERVAKAAAWLAREPRHQFVGRRVSAAEFGICWGA